MKTRSFWLPLLLLPLLASPTFADGATGDIILDAHFDNVGTGPIDSTGAPSNPVYYWTNVITGNVLDDGGNHLLELQRMHGLVPGFMEFDFVGFEEVSTGLVCVTFTCEFPSFSGYQINLRTVQSTDVLHLYSQIKFNAGGTFNCFDADDLSPSLATVSYSINTPMVFRYDYDMDAGTYDFYVDGVLILDDEPHGVTERGFGDIEFGFGFGSTIGNTYRIDDVLVQKGGGGVTDAPVIPATRAALTVAPNPFRAQTTVSFDRRDDSRTAIEVFDLAGRRVRTLAAGGAGSVAWDGRDTGGRQVPAGVYFVRIPGTNDVSRVVRLR